MVDGVKVMHFLPGRLRLRIHRLKDAPDLVRRLERELLEVPGIRRVQAKISTGSVLLEYDTSAMKSKETLDKLRTAAHRLLDPHEAAQLNGYLDRLR